MAGRSTRVAALQMGSGPDVERNLRAMERLLERAAGHGVELAVVPEGFALMGPEHAKRAVAEPLPQGGPILARCREQARTRGMELVLGGFWERPHASGASGETPERVYNACIHLRADGSVAATYRKFHLFDAELPDGTSVRESATVEPGHEIVVTEAPFGMLGLTVCYDVRFPELYARLVDRGAIAMAIPSAFTFATGQDHWHVLLRARAIETQSYVIAAAQAGWHFGHRWSYGHALVIDPWGAVVAEETDEGEGMAVADVEPELVEQVRARLPSLRHRRLR